MLVKSHKEYKIDKYNMLEIAKNLPDFPETESILYNFMKNNPDKDISFEFKDIEAQKSLKGALDKRKDEKHIEYMKSKTKPSEAEWKNAEDRMETKKVVAKYPKAFDYYKDMDSLKYEDKLSILRMNEVSNSDKLMLASNIVEKEGELKYNPKDLLSIIEMAQKSDNKTSVNMEFFMKRLHTFDANYSNEIKDAKECLDQNKQYLIEKANNEKAQKNNYNASFFIGNLANIYNDYEYTNKNNKNKLSKEDFEKVITNNINDKEPKTIKAQKPSLFMSGENKRSVERSNEHIAKFNESLTKTPEHIEIIKDFSGNILEGTSTMLYRKSQDLEKTIEANESQHRNENNGGFRIGKSEDFLNGFDEDKYRGGLSDLAKSIKDEKKQISEKIKPIARENVEALYKIDLSKKFDNSGR